MKTAKFSPTLIVRGLLGVSASGLMLVATAGCDDSGNPPSGSVSAKSTGSESATPSAPVEGGKKGAKSPVQVKTAKSGMGGDR